MKIGCVLREVLFPFYVVKNCDAETERKEKKK
jgi:hypothetical protein